MKIRRFIVFEAYSVEHGFWVEFKVPYSADNLARIRALPNTRAINDQIDERFSSAMEYITSFGV